MKRAVCLLLSLFCVLSLLQGVRLAGAAQEAEGESAVSESRSEDTPPQKNGNKLIALTFDDGPGKDTKRLLDGLKARGAHCTFFIVGYCAAARPSVVKQCYEDGHQIASHTYDHPWLTKLSDAEIKAQLSKTANVLDQAIGASNTYMVRPPYGDFNQRVLNALGVPAFFWSDDSGDWKSGATADSVYRNTMATAGDGDILLLHDSHSWSVDAALRIVDSLQAQGYEFVTVSELFRRRGVQLQAGHIYSWLRANGTNLPGISAPTFSFRVLDNGDVVVTMAADSGTTIRYTLDGTVPNANSPIYSGPIRLTYSRKLVAVAGYDMNGSRSNTTSCQVNVLPVCKAPSLQIDPDGLVTISAEQPAYYTLDGSVPTENSLPYQTPFTIAPGTVVRARCFAQDMLGSGTSSRCYTDLRNVMADVFPDDWYYGAMDYAVSEGLLAGLGNDQMDPKGNVTRGMLVTVLHRSADCPQATDTAAFSDVPTGKWYTEAIAWAAEIGAVKGFPDGSFRPDEPVTREQLATILWRYTKVNCDEIGASADLSKFTDADTVSNYARDGLSWAVAQGLLKGITETWIAPKNYATRAQLATVFLRYLTAKAAWEQ